MGVPAKTLIEDAAKKIGVIGRGKTLEPDELMDWLKGLKQMLDGWSLDNLMIPFRSRETLTLPAQQAVTIGPGGDLDTVRPIRILSLQLKDGATNWYTVHEVSLDIFNRTQYPTSARPRRFYFEDGLPLSTIYFDKIPYDPEMELVTEKPITAWQAGDLAIDADAAFSGQEISTSELSVATLNANIEFDRGYEATIVFNLAVFMAPDYDITPSPLVVAQAVQRKSDIQRANLKVPDLEMPSGMLHGRRGYYDVNEGPG